MINGVILYTLAIILTGISFMKDRSKTKDALMKSWKMFRNLLPAMLSIMLFVGLSLSILTPSFISSIIGEQSHAHQLKNENKMNFRSNKLKNT